MGGESTKDDVVFEAKGHHFQRLVRSEAIADQDAWLAICTGTCRRVKDVLDPVHINSRIGVSTLATREVPPWRWVGGPCISMSGSWPYDERVEASTIRRNALNRVGMW